MKKAAYEPSQLAMENRELRRRQEERDIARARLRQADKDKAARLRAARDEIMRTGLNGAPAATPVDPMRFKPIRWRSDRGYG